MSPPTKLQQFAQNHPTLVTRLAEQLENQSLNLLAQGRNKKDRELLLQSSRYALAAEHLRLCAKKCPAKLHPYAEAMLLRATSQQTTEQEQRLANLLFSSWAKFFGPERQHWPAPLQQASGKIAASIGGGMFDKALLLAFQTLRTLRGTDPTFGTPYRDVIYGQGLFLLKEHGYKKVAATLNPLPHQSLLSDSASTNAYALMSDPANLLVPILAARAGKQLWGGAIAYLLRQSKVGFEAVMGGVGIFGFMGEVLGFVEGGNAYRKLVAPRVDSPRNYLQDYAGGVSFLGLLKFFGLSAQFLNAILPNTVLGRIQAQIAAHAISITGLAATEGVQELLSLHEGDITGFWNRIFYASSLHFGLRWLEGNFQPDPERTGNLNHEFQGTTFRTLDWLRSLFFEISPQGLTPEGIELRPDPLRMDGNGKFGGSLPPRIASIYTIIKTQDPELFKYLDNLSSQEDFIKIVTAWDRYVDNMFKLLPSLHETTTLHQLRDALDKGLHEPLVTATLDGELVLVPPALFTHIIIDKAIEAIAEGKLEELLAHAPLANMPTALKPFYDEVNRVLQLRIVQLHEHGIKADLPADSPWLGTPMATWVSWFYHEQFYNFLSRNLYVPAQRLSPVTPMTTADGMNVYALEPIEHSEGTRVYRIGRGFNNEIQITHGNLGDPQGMIYCKNGLWVYKNIGPNDEPIWLLKSGNRIVLGDVTLEFQTVGPVALLIDVTEKLAKIARTDPEELALDEELVGMEHLGNIDGIITVEEPTTLPAIRGVTYRLTPNTYFEWMDGQWFLVAEKKWDQVFVNGEFFFGPGHALYGGEFLSIDGKLYRFNSSDINAEITPISLH